jgi:hypothetical protein
MSATLYALVMLQGTTLSFSPGYASPTECYSVYKGPFVSCFTYNPDGLSWTAFFKLPDGGFRTVGGINSEDECKRYIGAFRDGVPTACRQLSTVVCCTVTPAPPPAPVAPCQPCGPSVTPPPTPPAPQPQSVPEKKPDPVLIMDRNSHEPSFSNRPILTASASTGPAAAPLHQNPKRVVRRRQQQFDPIGAFVAFFTPRDY